MRPPAAGPPRRSPARAGATLAALVAIGLVAGAGPTPAGEWELDLAVEGELRAFPWHPQFADQDDVFVSPSLAVMPEVRYTWNEGLDRITVVGFGRLDAFDDRRTHGDLREANWLHVGNDWDVVVGVGKVFWGVAESRHLVDIVNQTDLVEDIDMETKLGQPMVNLNLETDLGLISLFYLPVFRERTFADGDARLRGVLPVDLEDPEYDSDLRRLHPDFAARWSRFIGDFDIGVSVFYGTSRAPRFLLDRGNPRDPELLPAYDIINQQSLDAQYTTGPWLWKLEALTRGGHDDRLYAGVGGLEYTLFGIGGTDVDLGLLAEGLIDTRDDNADKAPPVVGDNDVFLGTRLTLNDPDATTLLAGGLIDVDTGASVFSLEAERRIGHSWKAELNANFFVNAPNSDFVLRGIRDDDVIKVNLTRFF